MGHPLGEAELAEVEQTRSFRQGEELGDDAEQGAVLDFARGSEAGGGSVKRWVMVSGMAAELERLVVFWEGAERGKQSA